MSISSAGRKVGYGEPDVTGNGVAHQSVDHLPIRHQMKIPAKDTEIEEEAEKVSAESVEDTSAWLQVLAAFLVLVITWGPPTGFGTFESFYQSSLLAGHSSSEIAWIGSVQSTLLVAVGVVSGPLFDHGHLRTMLISGLSLCVVAFMLLSLCVEYYQVLLVQGFMFGIGAGMAYIPCLAMVSVRFHKRRAIAVGLATCGVSVGGLIFPILIRYSEPRLGFPWTTRVIGFVLLAISILVLALLGQDREKKKPTRKLIQLEAFTEPPFALFSIGYFLQILAFWIPLVFIPTYAVQHLRLSENLGFYLLAAANGSSIFGRLLPSLLARQVGVFNILMIATAACTVLLFVWIACNGVNSLIAFCILWGFFSGIIPGIVPVCVVEKPLSPSTTVAGTRLGMAWLACSVGTLIGNPIAGALIDTENASFVRLQVFAGAIMASAGIFYVWPWLGYEKMRKEDCRTV